MTDKRLDELIDTIEAQARHEGSLDWRDALVGLRELREIRRFAPAVLHDYLRRTNPLTLDNREPGDPVFRRMAEGLVNLMFEARRG